MKKQNIIISLVAILFSLQLVAQQNVAINTTGAAPDASAILDVSSTNKGLLVPRVALTQTSLATPITAPATSLLVYNTATINDVTPGYYFWDGTQWQSISSGGGGTQDDDWLPLGAANTALIYHEGAVNTKTLNNIAIVGPNAFATIQDAVNSLPATGGKVLLTAGTWTVTSQISFPNDNITIEGVGESSIIESSGNHSIFYLNSRDNIQIHNLFIRYTSYVSGSSSRNAIYLYRSANAKIHNCHIENAYRAVYLAGSSTKYTENNSIYNNYIQNSYYGITTGAGITPTNYYVRKNMVHNNKIINNERYGICFAGSSTSNNISDNEINDAVQGIVMFHSDSNIVSNNRILNVGRSISPGVGIGVQGASNNFITDNYISGVIGTVSNASAIRVIQQNGVWCSNTSITGNQIHLDGTMTGIRVTAPIGAVISNNYIKNTNASNAYPAIMVYGSSSSTAGQYHPKNVVIANNVVNAATTGSSSSANYSGIILIGNQANSDNGPRYSTVTGNSVSGYRRGITVSDGDYMVVSNNTSFNNIEGIYVTNCTNSAIIGNVSGGVGTTTTGSTGQISLNQ